MLILTTTAATTLPIRTTRDTGVTPVMDTVRGMAIVPVMATVRVMAIVRVIHARASRVHRWVKRPACRIIKRVSGTNRRLITLTHIQTMRSVSPDKEIVTLAS